MDVVAPQPGQSICDPACGTGGFLLAAHDYLAKHALDRAQKRKLKSGTFFGIELVDSVTRLCAMNLLLHGIGGDSEEDLPVVTRDALAGKHGEYEIVRPTRRSARRAASPSSTQRARARKNR